MKIQKLAWIISIVTCLNSTYAYSEGNSAALNPVIKIDPCRSEVSKFEETIGYLRQVQGNKAAAEVKEKLLPAKLENEILFKTGYCGLAHYIREKKLNR